MVESELRLVCRSNHLVALVSALTPQAVIAAFSSIVVVAATEEIAHVDVLLWLLFLLSWLLLGSRTCACASASSGTCATTASGSNI